MIFKPFIHGCHDFPFLSQGGIVANPNCSTIIALVAVTPLHKAVGVQRMTVATYQVRGEAHFFRFI